MSRWLALLLLTMLGACEWHAAAPLLTRADYAAPAIAGAYDVEGPDSTERARIAADRAGGFTLTGWDAAAAAWETDTTPVHLKAIRGGYYLVETPAAMGGISYVIARLKGRRIEIWLTACTALAGIRDVRDGCTFTSRAALVAAADKAVRSLEKAWIYPVPAMVFTPRD